MSIAKTIGWLILCAVLPSAAEAQEVAAAQAQDVVVTAQRSGIPVWRVRGGAGTLVLVGTIEEVAKGTQWNPEALSAALRRSDQVMFPQATQYTGGILAVLGAQRKVRRMQRLPAGQALGMFLPPAQMQRLEALQRRGFIRPGFETRQPLFVAYDLTEAGRGERPSNGFLGISRVDWKTDPDAFVRSEINKYHLRLIPLRSGRLSNALSRIAATPPAAQLPCLLAAADFAEAGPG